MNPCHDAEELVRGRSQVHESANLLSVEQSRPARGVVENDEIENDEILGEPPVHDVADDE